MDPINFFNSMSYLEPKCPKCEHKIEYGITTEWNEKKQAHICKNCQAVIE
jgi:phage FluMu protein Com